MKQLLTPALRSREKPNLAELTALNQQILLEHFSAAIILIDAKGEILHFFGPVHRYLSHPTGQASLNLFTMAQESLAGRLRAAIHRVVQEKQKVKLEQIPFEMPGGRAIGHVTIVPILDQKNGEQRLAVIIEEAGKPGEFAVPAGGFDVSTESSELEQLKAELYAMTQDHLAAIQDLESANEQLALANEEVMSFNEELQSANEELETSKEELQSINEELNTVNSQLTEKVEELTTANNDLANLFRSVDVATIFVDMGLRIKRFSPTASKLVNLLTSDHGRPLGHIAHNLLDVDLTAEAALARDHLSMVEKEVRDQGGKWYFLRVLPYRTLDDRIDGVTLTFVDVTRLKEIELEREKSRVLAASIVEAVRDPLLVLSGDLRVISVNPSFCRTFQVTPEETIGRPIYQLGSQQWDIPRLRLLLEEIIPQNDHFDNFEVTHNFPALGQRTMLVTARRIRQPGDLPQLILLAFEDVTVRNQTAEELRVAKKAAEDANFVKGQFVANVSHELRTPMTAIMGMLDLALKNDLTPPLRDYLETAQESSHTLLELLNEVLDFSRIDAEKIALEHTPFDLRTTLDNTMKCLALRAAEKGLPLVCKVALDVPDRLIGDSLRLHQVLVNLLGNAIKFSRDGKVTVTVDVLSRTDDEVELEFRVADSGIGISADDQERIFMPFTQADSSSTREFGGSGLGLAISRSLVELMGGRIWVKSELGAGSTFYFTMKLGCGSTRASTADVVAEGEQVVLPRALRILLAEDNPANRKLMQYILDARGQSVEVVDNGREAVERVTREDFDIVLMDAQMPMMDGIAATAAIRALSDPAKARVPIVVITAHAMKGDRERFLAAGMDGYISKPIDQAELLRTIAQLVSAGQ